MTREAEPRFTYQDKEEEFYSSRRAMRNMRRWRARQANGKVKGAWNDKKVMDDTVRKAS